MPIEQISTDTVTIRCNVCDRLVDHAIDSLKKSSYDARAIIVPACACKASQFLCRGDAEAPAHPKPGSPGHRRELLVNWLHALVDAGQERAELPLPDDLKKWFPSGLTMEPETQVKSRT